MSIDTPVPRDQDFRTATFSGLATGGIFGLLAGSGTTYYQAHMSTPHAKDVAHPVKTILRTTGVFAALGGIYMSVKAAMRGLRGGTNDLLNGAVAGCAAGIVPAVRSGNVGTGGVACVCFAIGSAFTEAVASFGATENVAERRRRAVYSPKEDVAASEQ